MSPFTMPLKTSKLTHRGSLSQNTGARRSARSRKHPCKKSLRAMPCLYVRCCPWMWNALHHDGSDQPSLTPVANSLRMMEGYDTKSEPGDPRIHDFGWKETALHKRTCSWMPSATLAAPSIACPILAFPDPITAGPCKCLEHS